MSDWIRLLRFPLISFSILTSLITNIYLIYQVMQRDQMEILDSISPLSYDGHNRKLNAIRIPRSEHEQRSVQKWHFLDKPQRYQSDATKQLDSFFEKISSKTTVDSTGDMLESDHIKGDVPVKIEAKPIDPNFVQREQGNTSKNRTVKVKAPEGSCQELLQSYPQIPRAVVASHQGSGSTWLRHLIQEGSGLLTGSSDGDILHQSNGFPGERYSDERAAVISTHYGPSGLNLPSKAIVLIRNPFDSIVSHYHTLNKLHPDDPLSRAPDSLFDFIGWHYFVDGAAERWYKFYDSWLNSNTPKVVFTYQQLQEDLSGVMMNVFKFLGVEVSERKFQCMLKNREGAFHRPEEKLNSNFYPNNMATCIRKYIHAINTKLEPMFNVTLNLDVPMKINT